MFYFLGVDVSANQSVEEIEDTEIFQMEYDKAIEAWALRTSTNKYWNLQTNTATVQATKAETLVVLIHTEFLT